MFEYSRRNLKPKKRQKDKSHNFDNSKQIYEQQQQQNIPLSYRDRAFFLFEFKSNQEQKTEISVVKL